MSGDWFGLTCECHLDGELVRGPVRELEHGGFVMETTSPLEIGEEFELRLLGGAARKPIYTRGMVEARIAHGALAAEGLPGVRFRILRFSPDYSQLLAGVDTHDDLTSAVNESSQSGRGQGEREWLSELIDSGEETEPSPSSSEPAQDLEEWEEYEPLLERAGVPLFSEDALAPEAIVIDNGELDDVIDVLAELGVKAERRSPDPTSVHSEWIPPLHLLVVTANQALKLRLPLKEGRRSFMSVAVADSDARMACSAVRRLGYQYVISRPVHPLAMSMLFGQAVFPDDDRRIAPREVLGCQVRWRKDWGRRRPGVIMDISAGGCQLLVRSSATLGQALRIRVPGQVVGGHDFTLTGRVIRLSKGRAGMTLGIAFDVLPPAKVKEGLQAMLALPGPIRLSAVPFLPDGDGIAAARRDAQMGPQRERRLKFRAEVSKEVVALEHGASQVKHILVSSDLTVDGMRVEAHPELQLDEQLDIALYEDVSAGAPLIISAVVARDDGRDGWWLRFVGVTPDVRERLAQVLQRFPQVTRLEGAMENRGQVVLGQVLVKKGRAGDEDLL